MIQRLAANVQSLSPQDRIGLLSDSYALCKAGLQGPEELVELLAGFKGERNDKVWSELSACLEGLNNVMRQCMSSSIMDTWGRFVEKLASGLFLEIGWDTRDTDDDNTKKLRTTLAGLMAKFSSADAEHMKEARKKCDAFLEAALEGRDVNEVLSADVRAAVLICGMTAGNAAEQAALFDKFVAAHNKAEDGTIRNHIYGALAKTKDKALRERALDWSLSADVRPQDLIYLPNFVTTSGRDAAEDCFQWIQSRYDRIYEILGNTSTMLFQHVVRISGAGFASSEKAAEVQTFWESRSAKVKEMTAKALSQTLEQIKTNEQFAKRIQASKLADEKWLGSL